MRLECTVSSVSNRAQSVLVRRLLGNRYARSDSTVKFDYPLPEGSLTCCVHFFTTSCVPFRKALAQVGFPVEQTGQPTTQGVVDFEAQAALPRRARSRQVALGLGTKPVDYEIQRVFPLSVEVRHFLMTVVTQTSVLVAFEPTDESYWATTKH